MSNIIPPLLSSSPPPMVATILFDDDDEFGNFTMATDLHSDDTEVLPPTSELPIPKMDSIDEELDRRKSEEVEMVDCITKCNNFQYYPDIPPDIAPEICDLELAEDREISEILAEELSNCTVVNDINPVDVDVVANSPCSQDDFADFHTYAQSDGDVWELPSLNVESEVVCEEFDDEFGDFNDCSVQSSYNDLPSNLDEIIKVMFPVVENLTEDFIDEDFTSTNVIFVQLKDSTDTPALLYQWSKSNSQSGLLQSLNIDTRNILYGPRWNESMPRYAATLGFAPLQPVKSEGPSTVEPGQELPPQSDIPSAEFDWVGSGLENPLENSPASTMLLDLEQLVASLDIQYSSSHSPNSINSPSNVDDLDDWEFWLRLTPPKLEKPQINNGTLQEKIEPISQTPLESNTTSELIKPLPNIDKTDTDFDDFHGFQSGQTEERVFHNWPTALRETHISNVKLDEPSWLEPTILTPELPRKELQNEEEFANFQSGTFVNDTVQVAPPAAGELKSDFSALDMLEPRKSHTVTSLPEVSNTIEIETSDTVVQTATDDDNDEDDEFTEFQSTTCMPPAEVHVIPEPLQPSILQPVKVENKLPTGAPTTINWPDPGITEDDLQRFNLYQPTANETVTENDPKVEDDDWTDFVSNQADELNNSFIHKPVQNGFQTSLVSNQYVVFASKPGEIDDEWTDFVSSKPPPEPPVFTRPPRSALPKLNLDWNGPPQFSSWSTNITPNIIANPTSFDSFQSYTPFDGDLFKNRITNKKAPNIIGQPKKNAVPSISTIPDLEFIAPKNRTWKK